MTTQHDAETDEELATGEEIETDEETDEEPDYATKEQIEKLRGMAYDEQIAADGICLTYRQADSLGDDVIDWMRDRLGLAIRETDVCVLCTAGRR